VSGARYHATADGLAPSGATLRPWRLLAGATCVRQTLSPSRTLSRLDAHLLWNNNRVVRIEFTQSARRHKIGKGRVRQVMANPVVVDRIVEENDPRVRLLILGDDDTGRALEVIAVEEDDTLIVIHAMDLRPKFRELYEEGKRP
jgi:hypothetical protein